MKIKLICSVHQISAGNKRYFIWEKSSKLRRADIYSNGHTEVFNIYIKKLKFNKYLHKQKSKRQYTTYFLCLIWYFFNIN